MSASLPRACCLTAFSYASMIQSAMAREPTATSRGSREARQRPSLNSALVGSQCALLFMNSAMPGSPKYAAAASRTAPESRFYDLIAGFDETGNDFELAIRQRGDHHDTSAKSLPRHASECIVF